MALPLTGETIMGTWLGISDSHWLTTHALQGCGEETSKACTMPVQEVFNTLWPLSNIEIIYSFVFSSHLCHKPWGKLIVPSHTQDTASQKLYIYHIIEPWGQKTMFSLESND